MTESKIMTGRRHQLTDEQLRQTGVCLLANSLLRSYATDIPTEHFVEPASENELCTQIAETNGLHSCDMTTTVNAFIWQGWLTKEQGDTVHAKFPSFNPGRQFTRSVINGREVLIAGREEHAIQAITGIKLYSAATWQKGLTRERVIQKVLGALLGNLVLNIGDGGHARLAVGFTRDETTTNLHVSNPYHPNKLEMARIDDVLQFDESNSIFAVARKSASLAFRPDIAY